MGGWVWTTDPILLCSRLTQETLDKSREALTGADEEEDEVKDAMSIVNLLQENLSMWNSETDDA